MNLISYTAEGWALLQKQHYLLEQGSFGSYQLGSSFAKLVTQVKYQPVVGCCGKDQQFVFSGRGALDRSWSTEENNSSIYLKIIRHQ